MDKLEFKCPDCLRDIEYSIENKTYIDAITEYDEMICPSCACVINIELEVDIRISNVERAN